MVKSEVAEQFKSNMETRQMHGWPMRSVMGWGKDYGAAQESIVEADTALESQSFSVAFERDDDGNFTRITSPWNGCTVKGPAVIAGKILHDASEAVRKLNSPPDTENKCPTCGRKHYGDPPLPA